MRVAGGDERNRIPPRPGPVGTTETATSASHEKTGERERATSAARKKKEPQRKHPRPSQKGAKKRKRVSTGVYSDRYGLAATVKVNGIQRERRFPRGTPIRTIQGWRDEIRGSLRTLPKGARHTLAHDAKKYLDQAEGPLVSIRALSEQLYEWRKELSGATCNHRRDALMNLVRVLYGSKAASGLSDLLTFPKAPPKPRGCGSSSSAAESVSTAARQEAIGSVTAW